MAPPPKLCRSASLARYRGTSVIRNCPPQNHEEAYALAPMVVLGGGAAFYERETPVAPPPKLCGSTSLAR